MTALEFRKLGVVFVRNQIGSVASIRTPENLANDVRSEVMRRVDAMREPPRSTIAYATCETCGDAIDYYMSGWCELCCLARRTALKEQR